jgi:hypothetical protein
MTHITMEIATRYRSRFVALYYLLTIVMGAFVLLFHGRVALTADIIATVCYLVLTAVFYDLSKQANRDREH